VVIFWVQAVWGENHISDRSDPLVVCLFTADKPCVCQDAATYTPPVTAISVPTPPPFAPTVPPTPM
jgi:hypothetical protein